MKTKLIHERKDDLQIGINDLVRRSFIIDQKKKASKDSRYVKKANVTLRRVQEQVIDKTTLMKIIDAVLILEVNGVIKIGLKIIKAIRILKMIIKALNER